MTEHAKKIVELQRQIQQSFLNIEEYCNPKTLLSRKRTGTSVELQLSRTIENLIGEVAEVKKTKINVNQMDVFSNEIAVLEQSSARLNGILNLMNVTKSLRYMKSGKDASLLIFKSEQEFNEMRERYPFDKPDIEARVAHIIYTLFLAEATTLEPSKPSFVSTKIPLKRNPKTETKIDRMCNEAEAKACEIIDSPNSSYHETGSIEQHDMFSTETFLNDLKKAQRVDQSDGKPRSVFGGPREWLASLKLEKCKVSARACKLLKCLTGLIETAAKHPTNHAIPRSIASIIQLFTVRARPEEHSGVDAAIFFNDCLFLAVEIERAKCKSVCNAEIEIPTDAFNFGSLLAILRKTGRNTLIKDVVYVKQQYLTWSESALSEYMKHESNQFSSVLGNLKRFSKLWGDVCSKNTYAWLMYLTCTHVLNLLIDSLLKLENFDRITCSKVLPIVNEIVDACEVHIRKCEADLKKKYADFKPGQILAKKTKQLKVEMMERGADQSLTELFDFKLSA